MIRTPKPPKDYCLVCNEVARRLDLSGLAKGIYYYLATLPYDWELSQKELFNHFTEGDYSLRKAFNELVDKGYILKTFKRNSTGKLTGKCYEVLWSSTTSPNVDTPQSVESKFSTTSPNVDTPQSVESKKNDDTSCMNNFDSQHNTVSPNVDTPNSVSQRILSTDKRLNKKQSTKGSDVDFSELLQYQFKKLNTPEFREAYQSWMQYRKEAKKSLTASTIKAQVKKLSVHDPATAIKMIENAIEKGWIGLYPLKDDNGNSASKNAMTDTAHVMSMFNDDTDVGE